MPCVFVRALAWQFHFETHRLDRYRGHLPQRREVFVPIGFTRPEGLAALHGINPQAVLHSGRLDLLDGPTTVLVFDDQPDLWGAGGLHLDHKVPLPAGAGADDPDMRIRLEDAQAVDQYTRFQRIV